MIRIDGKNGRRMPWKNGGGATVEIAVFPVGAGLDDFEWRVSMAEVETPGPFSVFPGIDRAIAILEGTLRLDIAGRDPITLRPGDAPLSFGADLPTIGTPVGGAVRDLNVMTRRGAWRSAVTRHAGPACQEVEARGAASLIMALRDCRLADPSGAWDLPAGTAACFENEGPRRLSVTAAGAIEIFLIDLLRA